MDTTPLKGRRALVTGASSGLGVDFARQLASWGTNLVLVARRETELRAVAQDIAAKSPVDVEIVACDLSERDAPARLHKDLTARGKSVDVLVNNAGFGLFGKFLEIPWERERNMLELDIVTLVHMTKLFAADMATRGFGYLLQVASIGAFQPTPTYASYAAAKSFVLSFGEAIHHELSGTGVSCTVLSPGVTATEFLKVSGQKATPYQRLVMMKSEDVARIGLEAMLRRTPSVVPGLVNAMSAQATRFMPRRMATAVAHLVMKNG